MNGGGYDNPMWGSDEADAEDGAPDGKGRHSVTSKPGKPSGGGAYAARAAAGQHGHPQPQAQRHGQRHLAHVMAQDDDDDANDGGRGGSEGFGDDEFAGHDHGGHGVQSPEPVAATAPPSWTGAISRPPKPPDI